MSGNDEFCLFIIYWGISVYQKFFYELKQVRMFKIIKRFVCA